MLFFSRNLRLAAAAFLLWSLAYNLAGPLLPLLAQQLGARPWQVGMVGAAVNLGAVLLILPISALSDRYGRRTALLTGWAGSAIGTLLMSLAHSWMALLPGAFFCMAAIAGLPALNALALDELPSSLRARGFSLLYMAAPLGALGGSALGGLLGSVLGLRAATAIAGISSLLATLVLLPISERPAPLHTSPEQPASGRNFRAALPKLLFAVAAAIGFLLLSLTGNFLVPYLRDVAHHSLEAAGLFTSLLAAAQVAWSLLFAGWPRRTDRVQIGPPGLGLSFPAGPLQAIGVCLAANAVFGLLLPMGHLTTTLSAILLRGSQFALQPLGAALLGEVVQDGPGLTSRLTLFSGIVGLGAVGGPVVGGWLYGHAPAFPFWATGVSAAAGALLLLPLSGFRN